jgi:hypothetical protein
VHWRACAKGVVDEEEWRERRTKKSDRDRTKCTDNIEVAGIIEGVWGNVSRMEDKVDLLAILVETDAVII